MRRRPPEPTVSTDDSDALRFASVRAWSQLHRMALFGGSFGGPTPSSPMPGEPDPMPVVEWPVVGCTSHDGLNGTGVDDREVIDAIRQAFVDAGLGERYDITLNKWIPAGIEYVERKRRKAERA